MIKVIKMFNLYGIMRVLKNPELYHPLERIYQKISHILAIKRANKIIAISKATKKDIIYYFPKYKDKIKVIYNGYNSDSFKLINNNEKKEIREKYNLPLKYILYIGRLETKKNIQNLIKGYKLIKNKERFESMNCFQKYKSYTNTNNIPTFCR